MTSLARADAAPIRGASYVDLVFDQGYVPELNPQELK
jgi:hypothetical protein